MLKGHTYMKSKQFLGFWDYVYILDIFIVLNPRNLPYYVCIWVTPLSVDIIKVWPLTSFDHF